MMCDACHDNRLDGISYVIPSEHWARISPTGDIGGRLCILCASDRLAALWLHVEAEVSVMLPGLHARNGSAIAHMEIIDHYRAQLGRLT